MSVHVLLNLLNKLSERKKEVMKCEACRTFYHFFATSLINSIVHKAGTLDSIYQTVKQMMQVESIAECSLSILQYF